MYDLGLWGGLSVGTTRRKK